MTRFLITGCPRSGTLYMAQALTEAGVETTHEVAFTPEHEPVDWQGGEIAWEAACKLEEVRWRWPSVKIYHQVREPWATIRSIMRYGFWTMSYHNPWINYVLRNCPEIDQGDDLEKSVRFWLYWNRLVEPYADYSFHIEDVNFSLLDFIAKTSGNDLGCDPRKALELPKNINQSTESPNYVIDKGDVPLHLVREVREQAKRYGY